MMKFFKGVFGRPFKPKWQTIYVIDSDYDVRKAEMKYIGGGYIIFKRDDRYFTKKIARANGTFPWQTSLKWVPDSACNYNSARILEIMLKHEKALPLFMGLDKELDALISEKLRGTGNESEDEIV